MKSLMYGLGLVLALLLIYKFTVAKENLIEAPVNRGPAWMNTTLLAVESNLPQQALPAAALSATLQRRAGMESAGSETKEKKENYAAGPLIEYYVDNTEHYVPTVDNGQVYGYFQRPPALPQLPFMPVTSVIYQ